MSGRLYPIHGNKSRVYRAVISNRVWNCMMTMPSQKWIAENGKGSKVEKLPYANVSRMYKRVKYGSIWRHQYGLYDPLTIIEDFYK